MSVEPATPSAAQSATQEVPQGAARRAADRLRVAVVGLGAIGLEHVGVYAASAEADLVAVVDPRDDVRADVAARTGARAFASLDEVFAAGGVDLVEAVSLCTPDHLHHGDARRLLEAGIHLLVEKPVSADPVEADDLVLLAESVEVVAMPGHTLRFEPRYHHAREVVAAGGIGELQHGYLRRDNKLSVARRAAGRVSVAFFLGIHDIDALQWITGQQVVAVQALATAATEPTGRQAAAILGTLQLADGAVVQIESAWNLPEDYPTDLDAAFRLVGSAGAISVHSLDAGMSIATVTGTGQGAGAEAGAFTLPMTAGSTMYGTAQGALALELGTFVRCCLHGETPPISMREAAAAVKVVVALEEALRTGATVAVEPVLARAQARVRG